MRITVKHEVSSLLCVSELSFLSRIFLHLPHSPRLLTTVRKPKAPFRTSWLYWTRAASVVCIWAVPFLSAPSLPTFFWKPSPITG